PVVVFFLLRMHGIIPLKGADVRTRHRSDTAALRSSKRVAGLPLRRPRSSLPPTDVIRSLAHAVRRERSFRRAGADASSQWQTGRRALAWPAQRGPDAADPVPRERRSP